MFRVTLFSCFNTLEEILRKLEETKHLKKKIFIEFFDAEV